MRILAALLMTLVAGTAQAAPPQRITIPVDTPEPASAAAVSNVIFLERCIGGCRVTNTGVNNAANSESTIPMPGIYNVTEFENTAGQTGADADAEWAMVVQCVREVYSPYAVEVTDVRPGGVHHVAVVAGNPPELGFDFSVLGVGLFASNCSALDNVMSFSFANAHNQTEVLNRVQNICWTASQEIAHSFGLDHQFEFVKDGRSACSDPMTYRFDCGGQKFFRNAQARCGEEAPRACRCGATQNSHKKLLSVFGPGTPLTGAPTIQMTNPQPGATTLPDNVIGLASSQRGIAKVQLFMNGFPYIEVNGAQFGPLGQGEQSYGLLVPRDTPESIYDIFVRASDDLGAFTDSATLTVTRGGPCTASEACLANQDCVEGRCQYPASVGEFGDTCGFPQFCKSLLCAGTPDQKICTQTCEPEDPEGCPAGLSCQNGVCFFADDGGCCSTGRDGWLGFGLLAVIVGFVLRRRR
jgi:hypothetical protein